MPVRVRWLAYCLFLISGATALVYQVTWVRNLSLIFGALVIPTFFMGGTLPVLIACLVHRHGELADRLTRLAEARLTQGRPQLAAERAREAPWS